jgi:hypothetical protein
LKEVILRPRNGLLLQGSDPRHNDEEDVDLTVGNVLVYGVGPKRRVRVGKVERAVK